MKKFIFIFSLLLMIGCSDDDSSCFQTWKYSEWCETSSNCNVVGCQEPTNGQRKFTCDELDSVTAGDIVHYRTDGCAKFYRMYIEKVD